MATNVFESQLITILDSRDLDTPDGRALYEYRLTDFEFVGLETLLRNHIEKFARFSSVSLDLLKSAPGFPALFVLYAAEWWRRRYNGSGFSWDPILRDLGGAPDSWSHTHRSTCVTDGLRRWNLSVRSTAGFRYLGTIALQGGLPIHLLAQAKGSLGRILRTVLKEATRAAATPNDIQGWVTSLNGYLPRTYRQAEIYALLTEVVVTVLKLKEEAGLTQSAGAITRLDSVTPSWREQFPLPIGDADAQKLIEQLIRDAAMARVERQSRLCSVERILERDGDGQWRICSQLTLPEYAGSSQIEAQFTIDEAAAPRMMDVTLIVGGHEKSTSLRKLAGHDKFRIDRCLWTFKDADAAEEHILRLSAPDGRTWASTVPRGEALDQELPWVFEVGDDVFPFVRQGGGSVVTSEALVAVPSDWTVSWGEGEAPSPEGIITRLQRTVYRVRGAASFSSGAILCRVRTGRADGRLDSYEWRGTRLWGDFINPTTAFQGVPTLYRVDETGYAQKVSGELGWRNIGTNGAITGNPVGPVEVYYPLSGELKHKSRMVVLPPAAKTSIRFVDATSGEIRFDDWRAARAVVVTPGIFPTLVVDHRSLSVRLKATGAVPEWVDLDVYWGHTPKPVRVRLPYPAQGARAFDGKGQELQPGSLICASRLAGVRIICVAGDLSSVPRLSMELRPSSTSKSLFFRLIPPAGSLHLEIRLQDYEQDISQLLACDDSPDASIDAILRIGSSVAVRLKMARYESLVRKEGGCVRIDASAICGLPSEALVELPVMATRLEFPGEEAIRLDPCTSEGVPTGAWAFYPEEREPGSWLIFPAADSSVSFRPTIWGVDGAVPTQGKIVEAMGIVEEFARARALDEAVSAIADDFLHEGWNDVQQLTSQLGHLPLVTLDLWRSFARSPKAMAALALRFGSISAGFLERFSSELPFAWETVPYSAWLAALTNLKLQCNDFGPASDIILNSHLDSRIADLTSYHPALCNLLGVTRCAASGTLSPEIAMFRLLGADGIRERLFTGEDCPLQKLLRTHSNTDDAGEVWPTSFMNGRLRNPRNAKYMNWFHKTTVGFHDGVVNLPILLAAQVAANDTEDWYNDPKSIQELREHIAFDPDWFTDAYFWTTALSVASGILTV